MEIEKVWITADCICCGRCEEICPEVFRIHGGQMIKKAVNLSACLQKIKEAGDKCPTTAIKYQ